MEKIDFKKKFRQLYTASEKKASFIEIPELNYLMIDGERPPEGNMFFQEAIEALYSTAYTLKFMLKEVKPKGYFDFVIPPLEALYWMEKGEFNPENAEDWRWTMMVMQPEYITEAHIEQAFQQIKKKKNIPGLKRLRLESLKEGKAIQLMHVGPYNEVGNAIEKLVNELEDKKLVCNGKHHEIYFNDPRRTAPEKLKTIVRHPYKELKGC